MQIPTWLRPFPGSQDTDRPFSLEGWRLWVTNSMLALGALLFPLALLVTIPVLLSENRYGLIALTACFYLFLLATLLFPAGTSRLRVYFWVGLVYIMAVSFHVALGPFHARPAWLVMASVMVAVLLGLRAAAVSVAVNAAILMALYGAMGAVSPAWAEVYKEPFSKWLMHVVNVSILTLGSGLPVGFLLNRLDRSLKQERDARNKLSAETEKLKAAYDAIQDESLERRQAEEALVEARERYLALFRSNTNLVYVMDRNGNMIDANDVALEVFGYAREDIPRLNYLELLHSDQSAEPVVEALKEVLETGAQARLLEVALKNRNGRKIHVQCAGSLVPGKNAIIGVATNITERKVAEEEKKRLETQLLRAQKLDAIGTLTGGIAHDFNNSLQAILGYTQIMLLGRNENESDFDKLTQIERAAVRASDLTKQLLTFSRKTESQLRPVDLNLEIQKIQEMLRRTIPRMVSIELQLERDLDIINADAAQIEQVIMNLAVNARDAMPDGGTLTVGTENARLDETYCRMHLGTVPGKYVMLSVSDDGVGMNKDTMQHIFEPFFTTKEAGKGTGLGLAMVYGIVKSHRGEIDCYSEQSEGTIFRIYFPVAERDSSFQQETLDKVEISGGTETILLVDDEIAIRDLARLMLTECGYTVLTADSGESALEAYRNNKETVSMVILDLNMPGMGGHKCLEEILKINPAVNVIIASGYAVDNTTERGLAPGVKGYVSKPYELRTLLKVIREILDQR